MPTLSAYNLGQIWVDYIAPGLVDRTHRTTLEPKFQLVAQDDPQDRVYLVHSGKIKLTRISSVSRDTLLDILGPGDVFGANALTHGRPAQWFCAATTVEPVEISWVLLSDVRTYLSTRPEAELTLMRALAGKSIELYQDAVHMIVRIQRVDARKQLLLRRLLRHRNMIRENAEFLTRLLLVADIDLGCRVIAHNDDGKARMDAAFTQEKSPVLRARLDARGEFFPV